MRWSTPSAVAIVLVLALAAPASAQVCHEGSVGDGETQWVTTTYGSASFIGALPADLEVVDVHGGALVRVGDAVVGLATIAGEPGPIVLVTRHRTEAVRPPLVRGPQRLALTARDHDLLAFTPAQGTSMESWVGYHASSRIDAPTRSRLDATCGDAGRSVRIYVDPTSYADLAGHLTRGSDRGQILLVLTAVLLVVGIVLGVLGYRWLKGRAQVEYADAALDRRFREIEDRRA